ncbi:MAG: hypothetical protein N2314_05280 [Brevinematales bacterium]|nr:hypothetical protein [Brevinematales bacterium]
MRHLFVVIGIVWGVAGWGMLVFSPVSEVLRGEKQLFVGVNEFLYVDQFSVWNVAEIGFRYGITERWTVGVRSWRLGCVPGITYRVLGGVNHWFRLDFSFEGGYAYNLDQKEWLMTVEPGLVFDVTLARPVKASFSTGWRKFSWEEHVRWRLSAGLWIRWGSWIVIPEVSVIRFASFDPVLPPFYLNPGIAVGVSF